MLNDAMLNQILPKVKGFMPDDLKFPDWVGPAAEHVVELAEVTEGTGREKKEFAKNMLKQIGKVIDIPGIPEPIESFLEGLLIEAAVELAWATKLGPKSRNRRHRRKRDRDRKRNPTPRD